MKIITICTNKGGVGKTSTSIALLDCLTAEGFNVLGIDLDPQGNLSKTAGIFNPAATARELFINKNDFPIYKSRGFDLIPADKTLSEVEQKIFSRYNSHTILSQKLESLGDRYDFCIIDCSSHVDIITRNALVSATFVICPIAPEGWSFDGFENIEEEIAEIRESGLNKDLYIGAVILQKFHERYILHREIFDHFLNLEYPFFQIPENIAVSEAQYNGVSLFDYNPGGSATIELKKFINFILEKNVQEIQ